MLLARVVVLLAHAPFVHRGSANRFWRSLLPLHTFQHRARKRGRRLRARDKPPMLGKAAANLVIIGLSDTDPNASACRRVEQDDSDHFGRRVNSPHHTFNLAGLTTSKLDGAKSLTTRQWPPLVCSPGANHPSLAKNVVDQRTRIGPEKAIGAQARAGRPGGDTVRLLGADAAGKHRSAWYHPPAVYLSGLHRAPLAQPGEHPQTLKGGDGRLHVGVEGRRHVLTASQGVNPHPLEVGEAHVIRPGG